MTHAPEDSKREKEINDFQKQLFTWHMFLKIGVFKYFAIFAGKHLCWSLFLLQEETSLTVALVERDSNRIIFLWILWKT